jgi:hypothetical protein
MPDNPNGFTDLPLARGAAAGVAAYVLGYLATFLWKGLAIESVLARIPSPVDGAASYADLLAEQGVEVVPWKAAGGLFYNAHLQRTGLTRGDGFPGTTLTNVVFELRGEFLLLLAVPPLLLVAAGALVTARESGVVVRGSLVGATVAVGYVPLLAAGTFVFGGSALNPDLFNEAVLLNGVILALAYPVAFGALGGALATVDSAGSDDGAVLGGG